MPILSIGSRACLPVDKNTRNFFEMLFFAALLRRVFSNWNCVLETFPIVNLQRSNPLAEIEGIGRRNKRKLQLRYDETRRLVDLCFTLAPTDDGAVAVALQPLIMERTRDKLPTALLFQGKRGARHDRGWVRKEARRLCLLAGVPVVCAHLLRGFHATAAIAAGASPNLVAAALGHESASITLTNYAAPGSAELASRRRIVANLLPRQSATQPQER